ncbi:MAG: NAD(P)H-dependent oxidoreductase [Lachnospiraceae bacterium]|nr:NAD(P)H-dependent oxidoreductase [Lachnospiraceae bacterium]
MKITVINGTEKKGVTYKLKDIFLEQFRDRAEITEFFLPKDGPGFCTGCTACFMEKQNLCKDAEKVQKIEKALLEADLLVFTSPAYVFHTTGAMKAMLDHFGYRWMSHRPAKEMFGKRAVIITQCLGAGGSSTVKDIKDSLSWWGISYIRTCSFKLMSEIHWDKLPEKKRDEMTKKLNFMARKMLSIDYSKPAHTSPVTKIKFYIVRMIQTGLGKDNPEYTDYKYWKSNGWIDGVRPWRAELNNHETH